jgi:hypothetical protein
LRKKRNKSLINYLKTKKLRNSLINLISFLFQCFLPNLIFRTVNNPYNNSSFYNVCDILTYKDDCGCCYYDDGCRFAGLLTYRIHAVLSIMLFNWDVVFFMKELRLLKYWICWDCVLNSDEFLIYIISSAFIYWCSLNDISNSKDNVSLNNNISWCWDVYAVNFIYDIFFLLLAYNIGLFNISEKLFYIRIYLTMLISYYDIFFLFNI